MKIASWNVNSVRMREERLLAWIDAHQPDVLCLQELKVTEDVFPTMTLRAKGYYAAVHGQKTYNGVAILSREEPTDIRTGFGDGGDDTQARYIEATVGAIRVASAYFPNGGEPKSFKYKYKLEWMRRLREYLTRNHSPNAPLALAGDFNVASDDFDVARPDEWRDTVLCRPDVREALHALRAFGFVDVFRKHHPEGHVYSWWDYRMLGFVKNNGLRIDYVYATEPLAARSTGAYIDREERKGAQPSDHAPVVIELS